MTEHQTKKRKMESDVSETEKASEKTSPPTPAKYTRGDLVTLLIGPDEQELVVCGQLLTKTSEFFEAALKKEWKEGQTRMVRLPEEDAETTIHYLDFVCGQGLPTRALKLYGDFAESEDEYLMLAQLYAFGERVLHKAVRNAVMAEVLRISSLRNEKGGMFLPGDDAILAIYQATPANSPVRRLLVDLHVSYGLPNSLTPDTSDMNCMIHLADLAKVFNERVMESQHTDDIRDCELSADDYFV